MAKNLVWRLWPKFGPPKFFFKNLAPPVTRYHRQLSSFTISKKTNDTTLRKLSDGRTNRGTRVISSDAVRPTSSD